MYILGISCYYHDAAACLLKDGEIVAAAQEERFTRIRHDQDFPTQAIKYCLKEAGITIEQVNYVGFYDKPLIKFERILTTYLATWPRSFPSFIKSTPLWLRKKLWIPQMIKKELGFEGDVLMIEHHLSHAASSFLVSPYRESAIVTVDGVGEWATSTICKGEGNDIQILRDIRFPHSLGLLYSAYTYYLGFKVNSAEYKVMGLAPYGEPRYVDKVLETISYTDDGSFKMNMKYFAYDYGLEMTNGHFERLFGRPRREPESKLEQFHKDVAMSVQKVTEEIVLRMVRHAYQLTGSKNLCMAGGVALNCVANGRVVKETPYKDVFIQPAAGDAGGAVGVATYIHHSVLKNERKWEMKHAYFGPEYGADAELVIALDLHAVALDDAPVADLLLLRLAEAVPGLAVACAGAKQDEHRGRQRRGGQASNRHRHRGHRLTAAPPAPARRPRCGSSAGTRARGAGFRTRPSTPRRSTRRRGALPPAAPA
ncbi:MAG: hypothetical protein L0Z51_00465 [Candidatus Latescibacteria bacterium]|nr:hypothetical protein [Candidatus Latescibacterota bacterium]